MHDIIIEYHNEVLEHALNISMGSNSDLYKMVLWQREEKIECQINYLELYGIKYE
jgi:hypothetical protein